MAKLSLIVHNGIAILPFFGGWTANGVFYPHWIDAVQAAKPKKQ